MALVLTLAVITLVTLLVIAFAVSMRVESTASKNFNDLYKARELAKGAIDQAVAQIRQATPIRVGNATAGIYTNYVTFPGGAYVYTASGAAPTFYPLYSNPSYPSMPVANTNNLNAGLWITGQNPPSPPGEFVAGGASDLAVEWAYVAEDGFVGAGPVSGHGHLIGRFSYWVDDEASKININTAYQRPAATPVPLPTSTNSEVDLSVLLQGLSTFVSQIHGRQSSPGFTTIEEVKIADGSAAASSDFNTNRFYLTTYSNDGYYPSYTNDVDVFDRSRLIVSSLNDPFNTTVGSGSAYDRLADAALAQIVSPIGMPPVGTFAKKYPVATLGSGATIMNVDGLKQLIANIIGYQADLNTTWPPDGGGSPPAYLGLAKTPYINEVQIRYDVTPGTAPNPSTVKRTVSVELLYMYDGKYIPSNEQIVISGLPIVGGLFSDPPSIPVGGFFTAGSAGPPSYRVFSHTDTTTFTGPQKAESTSPQITYNRGSHRLGFVEMKLPANTFDGTTAAPVYQGIEVIGDPAFNEVATVAEWQQDKGAGTLQAPNQNTSTGLVYPFGNSTNKFVMRGGPMQSIGELGYIHLPPDPALNNAWGHLTLQPGGGASAGQIPDWAMLDLFTVGGGTAGRININSDVIPGFFNANTKRLVPLKALLNNVGALPVATVAQQIFDDLNSIRVDNYGMRNGSECIFDTIGEICEVPSLATGANEKDKEEAIRRIANLITVRSNTFTIWVMAQSIKQVPTSTPGTLSANDVFTGEVRAQAVVERYENPPGSAAKFRVKYFRYM